MLFYNTESEGFRMTDYQKYINALRKCAKEHENDKTFTGHVIVSDLCRDTANLLEELEQESRKRPCIIHDENDNLVEIMSLEAGTTIEVSGILMEILDNVYLGNKCEIGVFCLAKNILCKKPFDKGNNNNWEKSSLREYLNVEYIVSLGNELAGALIPFERNLLTNDGMKDYRFCTDLISLISEREYQEYREYISDKSDWWWTLTAWSANSDHSYRVLNVDTDGSISHNYAYISGYGVSPVFLIKPNFKVKIIDDKK